MLASYFQEFGFYKDAIAGGRGVVVDSVAHHPDKRKILPGADANSGIVAG